MTACQSWIDDSEILCLPWFSSQIPYDITSASLHAFLGTHAKIITPDLGPAIHVTMDRFTGKTQEAFIEFFSTPDARAWVNLIKCRPAYSNKIGDRILSVDLSSQEELMREIFPRAKCMWMNSHEVKANLIRRDMEGW